MSLYKDLNNVQIDVSDYQEEVLTDIMQKKWKKRVLKKLPKQGNRLSKKGIGMIVAIVLTIGVAVPLGTSSLATTPFGTHIIERFINQTSPPNYVTYKTKIGETTENEYGKLTLNEVLLDEKKLLISSTFEPADGVSFNYQTYLIPKILINGKDLTHLRGGQSIEVTDSAYTIYGDIELSDIPKTESLQIEIHYDTFNHTKKIDNPWVFNITVPTNQLTKDTTTVNLNKTITLTNRQQITLHKITSTPLSTLVQYDLSKTDENMCFKIVSASGEEWRFQEYFHSNNIGDVSQSRFGPIDLKDKKYLLVPYNKQNEKSDLLFLLIKKYPQ
jgi:hypothetical protein